MNTNGLVHLTHHVHLDTLSALVYTVQHTSFQFDSDDVFFSYPVVKPKYVILQSANPQTTSISTKFSVTKLNDSKKTNV